MPSSFEPPVDATGTNPDSSGGAETRLAGRVSHGDPPVEPHPTVPSGVPPVTTPATGHSPATTGPELFRRLWAVLRAQPRLAAVVGVLAAAVLAIAGAVSVLSGPTVWTSTTTMLIDDPYALAAAPDQGEFEKLGALRAKYASLIGTAVIAEPVAAMVHLPVGVVEAHISAVLDPAALLLDVRGTWSGPDEAQRLSAATAQAVQSYVHAEDVTYRVPPQDQFTIRLVQPTSPAAPSGPSGTHALVLALELGALAFVVGFTGTQLVRNRALLSGPTRSSPIR